MEEANGVRVYARFEKKIVLVTGAGTGIGRAAALAFAREGAMVALAGRRRKELEATSTEIGASGGQAVAVPSDVSDAAAVEALVEGVVERFGRIDVAFNNAGVSGPLAPLKDYDVADFDTVMATNLRGTWLLMKHQVRAMMAQGGGAIVNTSSLASSGGSFGLSTYAASKGALDAMIRPIALEVGPAGIRVNNVSPGVTDTSMLDVFPAGAREVLASHSPLQRLARPDEIADAVLWLASENASFVTGQTILVDGGFNIAGKR